MRKWDESGDFEVVFLEVESKYKGFYAHIDVNPAPKKKRNLIRYLSKYLCRPQISLKRLLKYSSRSDEVVYKYNSHSSGKSEVERTSVIKFIGRMVQQILPPRFKRIRYYGLQSPSNRSRLTAKVCEAVGRLVLLPEIERRSAVPVRSSYKNLIELWWGEDPFRCKECGRQMDLARMWKFGKGWVFNIFERLFGYDLGPPGHLPDFCYG
ncbi:MAG: transposase [Pseudobacteriovorax sp.]|nr:transposase [Pseudobacteriovorax sp.]